jgi:hypothetical protein
MNSKHLLPRLIAPLIFFALIGTARQVCAAPSAPAGATLFGSVDIQKVISKYTKTAAMNAQIEALNTEFSDAIKEQASNAMLSAEDQQKLSDLLLKPTKTDADNQAISALQAKSQKDTQDLAELQQKKDLTDADRIRMQQLTQEQTSGQQALTEQSDKYKQSISDKNAELGQQVADDIRAAVATVAQQFAIYTANDVTQAVVNKLNGTK